MEIERELLGELSAANFAAKQRDFTRLFGQPKKVRRIALQATDFSRHDLDTRLRITNGKQELMQKVGSWQNHTKQELSVELALPAENIVKLLRIIYNSLDSNNIQTNLIQMENYLYDTDELEIKLTCQLGKSEHYNFEIEAKNNQVDIKEFCAKHGLKPDMTERTEAQWKAHNEKVNLDWTKLPEGELVNIIERYL